MDLTYLGNNIKAARKKMNLSQTQFCELVGLSGSYYSSIERGIKIPKLETFVRIAKALGATPTELLLNSFHGYEEELKNVFVSSDLYDLTEEEYKFIMESINMLSQQLKILRKDKERKGLY